MSPKKRSDSEASEGRPVLELDVRIERVAIARLVPDLPFDSREQLRLLTKQAVAGLEAAERRVFEGIPDRVEDAAAGLVERVRHLLGTHALAAITGYEDPNEIRAEIVRRVAEDVPTENWAGLLEAGIRQSIGLHSWAGSSLIDTHIGDLLKTRMEVNKAMPAQATTANYKVDQTGLPSDFDATAFVTAVGAALTSMGIDPTQQPVLEDAIVGMLLLDGNNIASDPTFASQISDRLWTYVQRPLVDADGQQVSGSVTPGGPSVPLRNKDAFVAIDGVIQTLRPTGTSYYQELATAARQICDGQRGAIVADPSSAVLLNSAVAAALQNYGSGGTTQGSFDLPPLTGASTGGGADEIIPDHVRGVAMHYAALQLEIVGLIKVVDRNVEIFMNGQLPVSNDMGGNALNAYYWDRINQMTESQRWMQFTRVLGAKGGEVSKEVQPNTPFDDLFMRFLSALSEYDRQQRVADLLGNTRGLSLTAEHVRKAGRDLAANATLYGYGYTQFSAKKMQHQIQTALNLLKLPDIQQAWGVQSAWQVVERVSTQEFHSTPNVVKYRTMAESGKAVLDTVA